MRTFFPNGLSTRVCAVLIALVAIPWVALYVATLGASSANLGPEALRKSEAVGRTAVLRIERAVGLGIALPQLYGMEEFLDGILAENPDVVQVAVTDLDGRVLHARSAGRVTGEEAMAGGRRVELPIHDGDRVVGQLRIVQDPNVLAPIFASFQRDFLIALVITALIALELVRFLFARTIEAPLQLAEELMERVRRGDLTRVAADVPAGEIGALLDALNRLIRQLNRRYEDLALYAEDVREAVFDPKAAQEVDQTIADLSRKRRFGGPAEQGPSEETALRRLTTLVATTVATLQLPILAALADPARGAGGLVTALAGAAAILAFAGRLLDPILYRAGSRGTMLAGLALAVGAVTMLPSGFAGPVPMVLAGALGLALMIHAGSACTGPDTPWFDAVAQGVILGAGLLVLLDAYGLQGAEAPLGAALLAGTGLVGLALAPDWHGRVPETWPSSTELATLLRRPPLPTIAGLIVAPLQAALAGFGATLLAASARTLSMAELAGALAGLAAGHALTRAIVSARAPRAGNPLVPATVAAGLMGAATLLAPHVGLGGPIAGAVLVGIAAGIALPLAEGAVAALAQDARRQAGERRVGLLLKLAAGGSAVAGLAFGAGFAQAFGAGIAAAWIGGTLLAVAALLAAIAVRPSFRVSTNARSR